MSRNVIYLDKAKLAAQVNQRRVSFARKIEISKQATLENVKNVAAYAAEQLAAATFPSGVGFSYAIKAMIADVALVYATPGRVYEILKSRTPHLAAAFWQAMKAGDLAKAETTIRNSGSSISSIIIGAPLNPNLHDAARIDKDGRVSLAAPLQLVSNSELEAYTKQAIKRLGKTASGWNSAADDLGANASGGAKGTGIHGKSGGHAKIEITETEVSVSLVNTSPLAKKLLAAGRVSSIMKETRVRLLEKIKSSFKFAA